MRNVRTYVCVQALADTPDGWSVEMANSCTLVTNKIGALALSVAMATYLSCSTPCTQSRVLDTCLKPVLEERGIPLLWGRGGLSASPAPPTSAEPAEAAPSSDASSPPLSPLPSDGPQPEATSFAATSGAAVSLLTTPAFVDRWSATGAGPTELLPVVTLLSPKSKWPLVYDPDGFAEAWLRRCHGDELMVLDASERSVYLSLERALVDGACVLLQGVAAPLCPALLPLVALGHCWYSHSGQPAVAL